MAGFLRSLYNRFSNTAEIDWDDLEASLVAADLGPRLAMSLVEELRDLGRQITADDVVEITRQHLAQRLPPDLPPPLPPSSDKPFVFLIVGVNGVGKTTTCAKLAHWLQRRGSLTYLAAADTFRAAATEQLLRWGQRLDIPVITGPANADPSSVCFNAHQQAIRDGARYLICDTAGRLHNRHNLMEELSKIRRTLAKQDPAAPHLTLLVLDASTGSNALQQAKEFHKASPLDGFILTKMDGSGKGGVAVAIHEQLGIPPRFLGTGEEPADFALFQRARFLEDMI
ncbi:fused signal recognition particle receptor [Haloferula luteola]|uniref:Fused signal recognition particle receptor n=1 Tax=Haloferula luteola TaxID=595692 RepID=A0A840V2Y5_9BACT|nr:signal recognition particle-docking protein FtsY [Haloferula luteola]MBB5350024.1 fused signal recognition particle receptor [Haloferula luteola]